MEWRCAWCGKPHEADDPPCDNCGHGTFERAVVRTAPGGETTTVWVCTQCGRAHPKHAPPCSRCGNPTLERRERAVDASELAAPGYLDLLTPRYALGLVVALGLGAVLLLGLAGVVDLPGLDRGVPAVEDVPGNATSLDGLPLADVEFAYAERLNALRTGDDLAQLHTDDRLDAVATHYGQRRVKAGLGETGLPSDDRLSEWVGDRCGRLVVVSFDVRVPPSVSSPDALGKRLAERAYESGRGDFPVERGLVGIDAHAIRNGTLAMTQLAC